MAKQQKNTDLSTEEKIREAARNVFTRKGYAATRTRDIAEEAGINLALLNYYFRSKEKLFELVMLEKLQQFFGIIAPVLIDPDLSLTDRLEQITTRYIDMLVDNPDLPLFILSEIRNHPERFNNSMKVGEVMLHSAFIRQLREARPDINPLHFMATLLGMIVFPFIARPILEISGAVDRSVFRKMAEERKKLIPVWVHTLITKT